MDTNLIWFEADPELGSAADVVAALQKHGVQVFATGRNMLRACTHLDVSGAQAEQAAELIRRAVQRMTPAGSRA